MLKMGYKDGAKVTYECTKRATAELAMANIEQLLKIALSATDEHIENHFGGETCLLDCIERYMDIYDWATEDEDEVD